MSVSCGNTRKASILLVRKLYTLMQNLGPLPDSVSLNMKLAYYEEGEGPTRHHCGVVRAFLRQWSVSTVTPQDYQPQGFKEAESETFVFEKEPVKLTMGEVVTPYHSLKLGMATERHRLEQVKHRVSKPFKTLHVCSTTDGRKRRRKWKHCYCFYCCFCDLQVEESVNVTEKWVLSVMAEELLSQVRTHRNLANHQLGRAQTQKLNVLLTCNHPQSEVMEEVKSEMQNTDMDTTGNNCKNSGQNWVFIPQQKRDEIFIIKLSLTRSEMIWDLPSCL